MAPSPRDRVVPRGLQTASRVVRIFSDGPYRRALTARTVTRLLAKRFPEARYVGVVEGGEVTFLHMADSVITPWIVATGDFQKEDFNIAWAEAQRLVPRPAQGVFLDVGANVGTTTLYALRTGDFSAALCMEPGPDNLDVLRLNVTANGLQDRVTVVAAACDAVEGSVDFWMTSGNKGDHRVARADEAPSTHDQVVTVPSLPLDDVVRSNGIDPATISMVWIDTQGHEPSVLAGATEVIRGGAPFCIELWPQEYRTSGRLDELLELLDRSFERYVDLHEAGRPVHPIGDLGALVARLGKLEQTDILLVPRSS